MTGSEPTPRPTPRLVFWPALVAIVGVAVWARLSRAAEVFVGGETIPVEHDCYYHLRRILLTAADFPDVPIRDPHINWPIGADCGWPPGFDQLGALFALVFGGGSEAGRARAAAILPVVLGAACVLGAVALTRALLARHPRRDWIALAAGWLLALLPQAIASSMVGRIDHHVAEALIVVLLIAWTFRRAARLGGRAAADVRADLRFELAGAALLTGAVHVFAGSVLYAATAAACLIGIAVFEPTPAATFRRALLGSGAPAFLIAGAALALLARPQVAAHGHDFSHLFPSFTQPALIAAAAPAIALAAATPFLILIDRTEGPVRPSVALRRLAAAGLAILLLTAAVVLALPRVRVEVISGLTEWLAKEDPYMASIDETLPIFLRKSIFDAAAWSRVYSFFGVLGLAAPLTLFIAIERAFRLDRARGACFAAFVVVLTALTLVQSRFGRELVVLLAIATAITIDAAAAAALARLAPRTSTGKIPVGALGLALAACVIVDPAFRLYLAPRPPPPLAALPAAALYLRDHTPPVAPGSASGVLAPWDMGFAVVELGRRPVVVSGWGPYLSREAFDAVERAWRGTEDEMLALMSERDLGYVVAGASSYLPIPSADGALPFVRAPDGRGLLNGAYFRRMPMSPLIVGGSGAPEIGVSHLLHLMPRFASPQTVGGLDVPIPRLWVYERVAGARLTGAAASDGRVVARLPLESPGRRLEYVAWADSKDGRFTITVPLPTAFAVADLTTGAAYRITIGDGPPVERAVPEAAVRSGDTIVVH
jgi:Archaeal glycosylation protein B long peripheral domain